MFGPAQSRTASGALRRSAAFTFLELMLVVGLIAIMFIGTAPLLSASGRERRMRSVAEDIQALVRAERSKAQTAGERRVVEVRPGGFFEKSDKRPELLAMPTKARVTLRAPGENWEKPSGQEWEFSPIGLVTPMSVRLQEDDAWMELDFDMLTGRLAEERYAF